MQPERLVTMALAAAAREDAKPRRLSGLFTPEASAA